MKSLPCAQLRQPQSLQSDMRVQDNFFCFFSVRKRGHVFRSAQQPTSNCETQKTKKGPSAILVLLLENLPTPHCPTNSPCQSCSSYAASRPPRRSSEKRTTPKTPAWLAWSSARPKRLLPVVAAEPTPKPTTPQARRKGKKRKPGFSTGPGRSCCALALLQQLHVLHVTYDDSTPLHILCASEHFHNKILNDQKNVTLNLHIVLAISFSAVVHKSTQMGLAQFEARVTAI